MSRVELRITPVIVPNLGWDSFLKDVTSSIGRSVTKSIDESGQKLSNLAKFLITIQEFCTDKSANPLDVLRDANLLLQHLSFSFLVAGSSMTILRLLELTPLAGRSAKADKGRVVLLSGTLGEWKLATIDLCNHENADLRWCGQTFLEFFSKLGLGSIFANYTRKIRNDGTLLLEHK